MADNVDITPGAGATVATDDVGGAHFQRFKLHTSEDGSAEPIGDDDKGSTRALHVAPRTDLVIPTSPVDSSGLTIAATAYSIGDTLGAGWTIPNAAKASGGFGRIEAMSLVDVADVTDIVHLWVAQETLTFGTDNAAPSISDADAVKLLGRLSLSMVDLGGCRVGVLDSISLPYVCNGTTNLYVFATTGTAHTFFGAVTDLKLRVTLARD